METTKSNWYKDQLGNKCKSETTNTGTEIINTTVYELEDGKTTLRGEYPKLKNEGCVKPERLCCNYGTGFKRCEFMTFESVGRWYCSAHK